MPGGPLLEWLKSTWSHVRDRKMYSWLALYTAFAWTVFEALDALDVWNIPTGLVQTVHILLLLGFPTTLVLAWYHGEQGRQYVTRGEMAVLAVLAALGAGLLNNAGLLPFTGSYRVDDPRKSFLVVAQELPSNSEAEITLASDAASAMTSLLTGWSEIRAVPQVARAGAAFELGLSSPASGSLTGWLEMARSYGVGTLIVVTAEIVGETADLQAALFDVASLDMVSDPEVSRGSKDDVYGLVVPIAQNLLGLSGAPPELLLERESSSLTAIQQTLEAQRMLARWELEGAERAYLAALQVDSAYARAHHELAMTLYWQAARDPHRSSELAPDVVRHAQAAVRHIDQLPYRDSLHTLAFSSLARDAYEEARGRYTRLAATDSSDVFAWLLLGATEYRDEGTRIADDGTLRPRANWNVATRSFLHAASLAPHVPLGYGYLFELYERTAAESSGCPPYPGFRRSAGAESVNLQAALAADVAYFCPVFTDSLEWWTQAELEAADRSQLAAGGEELFRLALGELERWTRLAPDNHRPLDELSEWYLQRRRRMSTSRPPELADSLAEVAFRYARIALQLVPDTTPERWIRLGSLQLATGAVAEALETTETGLRALEERDGPAWEVPEEALNLYVATGRIERMLELVPRAYGDRRTLMADPETEERLLFLAEVPLHELRVLGGLGLEQLIEERFEAMEGVWDRAGYGRRQRDVLRRGSAEVLAPALAHSDRFRSIWLADASDRSPYWAPYFAPEPDRSEAFDTALTLHDEEEPHVRWTYVLATFAAREGLHEEAARLMSIVRAAVPALTTASGQWALRASASLALARALEAMGDARAADEYEVVLRDWTGGGELVAPLVREAENGLARSRRTQRDKWKF